MNIDIKVPEDWAALTQKQLKRLFKLLALPFDPAGVKLLFLLRVNSMSVITRSIHGKYILRHRRRIFEADSWLLSQCTDMLHWIDTPPPYPVHLERIRSRKAVQADFQGVPFETYIITDNLYQGYLMTRDPALLDQAARALYPGLKARRPLKEWQRIAVFYWIASLKSMLSARFSDFFGPIPDDGTLGIGSKADAVQAAMNAQIRALTKGDITKEQEILKLDTWRALTELDAQAREYKQMQARLHKP